MRAGPPGPGRPTWVEFDPRGDEQRGGAAAGAGPAGGAAGVAGATGAAAFVAEAAWALIMSSEPLIEAFSSCSSCLLESRAATAPLFFSSLCAAIKSLRISSIGLAGFSFVGGCQTNWSRKSVRVLVTSFFLASADPPIRPWPKPLIMDSEPIEPGPAIIPPIPRPPAIGPSPIMAMFMRSPGPPGPPIPPIPPVEATGGVARASRVAAPEAPLPAAPLSVVHSLSVTIQVIATWWMPRARSSAVQNRGRTL